MDWSQVQRTPKYNPHQFELCRHLDGMAKWEFAKRAGLSMKRYSAIESGEVEPTDEEVKAITKSQSHVVIGFFEQWPKTELDISGCFGKNIPIDYYKYKIFRNINPTRMKAI